MIVQITEIQDNSHNLKPGDTLNIREDYIFRDERGAYLKLIDPKLRKIFRVRVKCL